MGRGVHRGFITYEELSKSLGKRNLSDENLAQALHTLNGDTINAKIDDTNGRLGKLITAEKSDAEIIRELFLATWSRTPTEEEIAVCKGIVGEAAERKEGLGDVLWALINAKEFIYVR